MLQKPDTEQHSSRSTHFGQTNGVYLIFNVIHLYDTR